MPGTIIPMVRLAEAVEPKRTQRRRPRFFPDAVKAKIVAETYLPGATVVGVAKANDVTPSRVSAWRKLANDGKLDVPGCGGSVLGTAKDPEFVPVQVAGLGGDDRVEVLYRGVSIKFSPMSSPEHVAQVALALGAAQ